MGLMADKCKNSLNSILSIIRNSIPRLNIILLLKRVNGVKGLIIIIIGRRIQRGVSLKPRRIRITGVKGRAKRLIVILSLSLRPISRPTLLRYRPLSRKYNGY